MKDSQDTLFTIPGAFLSLGVMTGCFIGVLRRTSSFRVYQMAAGVIGKTSHQKGLRGVLSKKGPYFFQPKLELSTQVGLLEKENHWIRMVYKAADQAVKQKRLLLIYPLIDLDFQTMNQPSGHVVQGALMQKPTLLNKYFKGYCHFMYLADPSLQVIVHESAHFWLFTQMTKEEKREFTRKMNLHARIDLTNLYKKSGDESFEDKRATILSTLIFEDRYRGLDAEGHADEYFAHILELSLESVLGYDNIKKLLPRCAYYISKIYQEKSQDRALTAPGSSLLI